MSRPVSLLLALLLSLAAAGGAAAQQIQVQGPPALSADDPRAQLLAGLVKPILSGARAEADAYLAKHAQGSFAAGARRTGLDEIFALVGAGEFEMNGFREGLGGVIAELRRKGEEVPSLAVIATVEGDPHRFSALRVIPLQLRRG